MRLLIVQFGDYAEAENRFARGLGETYYAQKYTVDFVAALAKSGHAVKAVSLLADVPTCKLPSGVESAGIRLYPGRFRRVRTSSLIRIAEAWNPSHLVLGSPLPQVARWASDHGVDTLALLADSFLAGGLRNRLRNARLARALNLRCIRWVGNHGFNASSDLVRIGVDARKVVPYDWPSFEVSTTFVTKSRPEPPKLKLVYVGSLILEKGVGDLLEAVALARATGKDYSATLIGSGDEERFRSHARRLGISDHVRFTGRIPRENVVIEMNAGDVVVVPSRHEYSEGMPMTIYEGLCSRSPVVVSDHPMFRGRIVDGESGVVFRASDPRYFLRATERLVGDGELYRGLSERAPSICAQFFGPLKWDRLITLWLARAPEADAELRSYSVASNAHLQG